MTFSARVQVFTRSYDPEPSGDAATGLREVLTTTWLPQALKGTRTVDRYKLVWSPRPEFVRVAARYGATIVPFGAVGCEESVGAIMNAENTVRVLQGWGRLQGQPQSGEEWEELQRMRSTPARRGVNADKIFENELDVVRCPTRTCLFAGMRCAGPLLLLEGEET